MSKIKVAGKYRLSFICPGCDGYHVISHNDPTGGSWEFNNDFDTPTISPSILLRGKQLTDKGNSDIEEWRDSGCPKRSTPFETVERICHSYITDGKIQFLIDSTHKFAGMTVDLPEIV